MQKRKEEYDNMDDVNTRDKYEPHYGMSNLNSRQEEKKRNSTTKRGTRIIEK